MWDFVQPILAGLVQIIGVGLAMWVAIYVLSHLRNF